MEILNMNNRSYTLRANKTTKLQNIAAHTDCKIALNIKSDNVMTFMLKCFENIALDYVIKKNSEIEVVCCEGSADLIYSIDK